MQPGIEIVVGGQLVELAAFLVQPDPPAPPVWVEILYPHGDGGADAGEAVDQQADKRPVAQPDHARDINALQQQPRISAIQHRRLAPLHHMARPAHGGSRINRQHLADHQPVAEHADGGQAQFHGRGRVRAAQKLHIGRHMQGLDVFKTIDATVVEKGAELRRCPPIGPARVRVADGDREKLPEPPLRALARRRDQRGHPGFRDGQGRGERNRDQVVHQPFFLQK